MKGLEKFIDNFTKVLDKPVYVVFLYISAVLVFVSIVYDRYFWQIWIFFIYSVAGSTWRYIEKDTYKNVFTKNWQKFITIIIYHLGNVVLFYFLLKYLNLI
jgi:hypothetical protein